QMSSPGLTRRSSRRFTRGRGPGSPGQARRRQKGSGSARADLRLTQPYLADQAIFAHLAVDLAARDAERARDLRDVAVVFAQGRADGVGLDLAHLGDAGARGGLDLGRRGWRGQRPALAFGHAAAEMMDVDHAGLADDR